MNENTQLYYDLIIEQINLSGDRLNKDDYTKLLEALNEEVGTRLDTIEVDNERDEFEDDDDSDPEDLARAARGK